MKKISYNFLASLLAAGIFASCNEDIMDFEPTLQHQFSQEEEATSLTVRLPDFIDESHTRSSFNSDNLLIWQGNDTIGIFPEKGYQVAFPMAEGAGTQTATFSGGGWGLCDNQAYSAYYPFIGQFYLDKSAIPLKLSGQTQTENGNSDHIGAYDYMAAFNAKVNSTGEITFDFKHLVSILHLSITMPKAGTYKSLILQTDGQLAIEASLDLEKDTVIATVTSAIQVLKLKNLTLNNSFILDTYVAILPIDMKGRSIWAKVYDDEGNVYTTLLKDGNYEPGHIYSMELTAELAQESTGLPIVIINTPENVTVPDKHQDWLKGTEIAIINPGGKVNYESNTLQIRGRGNSTWSYPKKPYALKLDSKSEILGMKKHKRWCLLANWMDRTLLRNEFAFSIAKQTDLSWTPSGQFVELILNGKHEGNYYLCEQIKVDKNRLNIVEMKEEDISGDALTGGYLMELDVYFDEVNKFKSETKQLPYMFKSPDEDVLQPEQSAYFENYINTMESCLYSDNWLENREYADYMDIGSFVDWWFVYELAMNSEPNHPKSSYVHKNRLGKLKAGPVWDFDWATFVPSKANKFNIKTTIYYERLFNDPAFIAEVKNHWVAYKERFIQVPTHIRSVAAKIKASNEINYKMWPLLSSVSSAATVNGDQDLSFDDAVELMISSYETKLSFLDEKISEFEIVNDK